MNDITPCEPNQEIKKLIDEYVEELKASAHTIGHHGLSEKEFYESGLFEGAIERIRGQKSASMAEKKQFVALVLNHMMDCGFISEWEEAGASNRFDLSIILPSGRIAVVELKGCLDGNNTTISDRPDHAEEFIIWSLCQNKSSDIRKGVWSALHTRIGADIVDQGKRHDGLIVWDWACNTKARPCPKVAANPLSITEIGAFALPPPCLFAFPATIPSPRNNPKPPGRSVMHVELLKAFADCFGGSETDGNSVEIETQMDGANLMRRTSVVRAGQVRKQSKFTAIKRR